jgi:hypothetical protein
VADPDDWARAFNVYVIAGQVAGPTLSPESTLLASAHVDPDSFYAQVRMLLETARHAEARTLFEKDLVHRVQNYLEGSYARMEPAQDLRLEKPDSELKLYKEELKRLRFEQSDQDRQARERRKTASAYLDEAIALAHPIALRLLGWLHVSDKLDLGRVFEVFGASPSTFEGVARLHLMGALKFDDGDLTITSLGSRVLSEFGLIDSNEAEESGPPTSP